MLTGKKHYCLFLIFWYSCIALADIPTVNVYRVEKRNYALEPQAQRFTISAFDKALLGKPPIAIYTQLNPLNPNDVYTIPPYSNTEFLPSISKWMIMTNVNAQATYSFPETQTHDRNNPSIETFVPAHWISLTNARGQYIIEPINYIFIIYAANIDRATELFNTAANKAGFTGIDSQNHSHGYHAYIGNKFINQLTNKNGQPLTFSNGNFKYQNDHFRVFGAYPVKINHKPAFVFVASVSEESGIESEKVKLSPEELQLESDKQRAENPFGFYINYGHHFVSFSNAKNNLAVALIKSGHPTYYSTLDNMVNTLGESTEDHDGNVFITEINR